MSRRVGSVAAAMSVFVVCPSVSATEPIDSRLREAQYDPRAVVTVPVKRGVVTLIELDHDEAITDVAAGLGSDCSKPEATWCITTQAGSRTVFIKPKSAAAAPNNLAVVTDKRTHSFRLVVLADRDGREPVYRLLVKAPVVRTVSAFIPPPTDRPAELPIVSQPSPQAIVAERLKEAPTVVNADYTIAEGKTSDDIVPTLIFDDGRFTYLRFPGNREVPAVFQVLGDGSEALVNTRMEDDLLVIDRVSRKLVLRAGSAVVGVWNESFDLDGLPAKKGTTVDGVERVIKAGAVR
jgi:type IV secretion system protein VirB9